MCCGKGGDLRKFYYYKRHRLEAPIYSVTFIDLVKGSVEDAISRYRKIKKHKFKSLFIVSDTHKPDLKNWMDQHRIVYDLVSCQFSLHYSFESEERAKGLMNNISCRLRPGGYFIATIPNSKKLIEKMSRKEDIGNQYFKVEYDKEKTSFEDFGNSYTFTLNDAVEHVPEFTVNMEVLKRIAQSYNLNFINLQSFEDFYKEHIIFDNNKELLRKMMEVNFEIDVDQIPLPQSLKDISDLYIVIVFQKDPASPFDSSSIETFWDEYQKNNWSTKQPIIIP